MNYVQSFITNIAFPTSLDELYNYAHLFNIEQILTLIDEVDFSDPFDEDTYTQRTNEWTAPKWAKTGDIVFFMHSKTAISKITRLKTELLQHRDEFRSNKFWTMMNAISRAKALYSAYGGKIFAVAKITGHPHYIGSDDDFPVHWTNRIYAETDSIFLLENPVDISEFNSKITISRTGAITAVFGDNFDYLKSLILHKNKVVESYFKEAVAEPMPLHNINENNWLTVVNKHRRSFFLEEQFRSYYVNSFLSHFGDIKTFWRECRCIRANKNDTFVDNVIKFNGMYLPVEVKLSVSTEQDIIKQISSYCRLDELQLDKDKHIFDNMYSNNVLVIDTDKIYIYSDVIKDFTYVIDLDDIKTTDDIIALRSCVSEHLG